MVQGILFIIYFTLICSVEKLNVAFFWVIEIICIPFSSELIECSIKEKKKKHYLVLFYLFYFKKLYLLLYSNTQRFIAFQVSKCLINL